MSLTSTSVSRSRSSVLSGLPVLSGVAGQSGLSDLTGLSGLTGLQIHDAPRPRTRMAKKMKHGPTAQHTQQDGH